MRSGHRENVRCPFNQRRCERLAAEAANLDPFFRADFNCMRTRRLPAYSMDARRNHFNVLAISKQTSEKAFRNGTPTDVPGTDKDDAFHELQATRQSGASN